jgi:hypothetical protein
MTHYELFLAVSIAGLEVLLCVLVFVRHVQGRLPFFTGYAVTILAASLSQMYVIAHYGFRGSVATYYYIWISYGVVILARSATIVELFRNTFKPYQGIWGLTWRLLALMTLFLLVHGAIDAKGQTPWFAAYGLTVERGIDIASFLILATILLIGNYYRLPIENIHKWIALGICFFCVVEFANSSVLRNLLAQYMASGIATKAQVDRINDLWNTIYAVASAASLGSWCYLLRKPLPEPAQYPVLLPAGIYQEISPAINLRLRAFNDRLEEMLKS